MELNTILIIFGCVLVVGGLVASFIESQRRTTTTDSVTNQQKATAKSSSVPSEVSQFTTETILPPLGPNPKMQTQQTEQQKVPVPKHSPVHTTELSEANPPPPYQRRDLTVTGLPTVNVGDTVVEKLEKLVELRKQNLISQNDYELLKARLLQPEND
jgi:FtsZ-interacting cell division protein ZipA